MQAHIHKHREHILFYIKITEPVTSTQSTAKAPNIS